MASIHIFLQMPYRQMEGFTRQLATILPALKSADYTTLFRRIQRMDIAVPVNTAILSRDLVVAVDSTGLKVTNRGEWMREKWKVHRGWINVHAMIDVETNQILSLKVTDETTQDDQVFEELLDQAKDRCDGTTLKSVLEDGAYDRNHCFNELEKRGIRSGIKTRINASRRSSGSPNRAECVRERDELAGYGPWAEKANYGMRWKVEGLFSSIKRIFGESVRASSREGMFREAQMKFRGYNIF